MSEYASNKLQTNRRGFLWVMAGLLAGVFVATTNVVVRYLIPPLKLKKSGRLSIPSEQIPIGSSLIVDYGGSPAILVNTDGNFSAFSAVCTHLGCLVKWVPNEKIFYCPCHAGKFDKSGKVISGPPPEPLHQIPIEVTDGNINFI